MKISIVTPSFQQGQFLERTMLSVLQQPDCEVEYLVADGGSTDGSKEIIERHASRLAWWRSAQDSGQYAAVAEGFQRATGEIFGWLNSDDLYTPWALGVVADIFQHLPEVEWLTTTMPLRWDARGRAVRCLPTRGYSRAGFFAGENLPRPGHFSTGYIQQESTFWRRSLWERAGSRLGGDYPLAGDFELWARFFKAGATLYAVDTPLGGFRFHGTQKTGQFHQRYAAEAEKALRDHGGRRGSILRTIFRRLAYENLPSTVRGVAGRLGWLQEAKVVRHQRQAGTWRVENVWA